VKGFTIIEMMLVITIVGIIAALGVPAYTGYTRHADRANAKSNVYEIAQVMERAFTEDRAYNVVDLDSTLSLFNSSDPQLYTYSINRNATSYDVIATANESRDPYDLTIDERGSEGYRANGATAWTSTPWDQIPD